MDVPRKDASRNRMIRRIVYASIVIIIVPLITYGLSQLKPAAPPVERATVWIDQVKRGPMIRQVRGLGTLVPEEILWIPAESNSRVDKIMIRPGTIVEPDTILMKMSNPEVELAASQAEWALKAAEATYTDLKVKLESGRLDQEAAAAKVASEYAQAKLNAEVEARLGEQGLTSDVKVKTTKSISDELMNRSRIEREKADISAESIQAQLAAQEVNIQKLRAEWELKKKQLAMLDVRAGVRGVLQQLGPSQAAPVEVGQHIPAGGILAKVAQPSKLKAELKIAETQAKDILIGQPAQIDTRNGFIDGKVSRIDPAVQNGTVTVDVRLEGALPNGARPDLSVDGTVELERLNDVVYVGRPVFGQPNSTITLFRLEPDGREATRVQVKLGRTSVNTIEVVEGLKVGDQVVLSDMTAQDAHNRISLN
jgi:HlyD family secretion protein